MKNIMILSSLLVAAAAIVPMTGNAYNGIGGGKFKKTVNDCSPEAMRRALDEATLEGRAVITVVSCGAGSASGQAATLTKPRRRVQYRQPDCNRSIVYSGCFVEESQKVYKPVFDCNY